MPAIKHLCISHVFTIEWLRCNKQVRPIESQVLVWLKEDSSASKLNIISIKVRHHPLISNRKHMSSLIPPTTKNHIYMSTWILRNTCTGRFKHVHVHCRCQIIVINLPLFSPQIFSTKRNYRYCIHIGMKSDQIWIDIVREFCEITTIALKLNSIPQRGTSSVECKRILSRCVNHITIVHVPASIYVEPHITTCKPSW